MNWSVKASGPAAEVARTIAETAGMPHSLRLAIADILSEKTEPGGASVYASGFSIDGNSYITQLQVNKFKLSENPSPWNCPKAAVAQG